MNDALATAAGMVGRDRPRSDGAVLGRALAALAAAGRRQQPDLPDPCATCAFRQGAMANTTPGTVLNAFNCTTRVDSAEFGCHHGMKDGEPVRPCAGWLAAQAADWPDVQRIMETLDREIADVPDDGLDPIRDAHDGWAARIDPEGRLDNYQRGRAWNRDDPCGLLAAAERRP